MTDVYQSWRDMVDGKKVAVGVDRPVPGYFKKREGKGGPWRPVAIWWKDGELVARVGNDWADPAQVWSWCAANPIAKDVAKFAFENGHWPDEPPPMQRSNMPSDPLEALKAEIEDKTAAAERLLADNPEIKSQLACDLARNIQAELLALNKRADGMFHGEKDPLTEAGRIVDEKFRFRAAVKVLSDRLRSRFETFMRVEERRQQAEAEAKFKAERAAAEAERQRIEDEQAKLMRDDPISALTSPPPEVPELPLAPESVKVNAGGGFGRKAGLKTKRTLQITDLDAVFQYFKGREEVHVVLSKLANASLRAGVEVPGTKTVEERCAA